MEEKPIGRQIIYCSTRKKYLQQDRKIFPRMLKLQCHMIIGNIIYIKKFLSLHFIKFLKTDSYNYLVTCMNTGNQIVHICGGCILLKIISQDNDLCKTRLTVKLNRNSKQHGGLVQYNLTLSVGEQDTPTSLTTEAVEPLRLPISVVKVLWKSAGTVVLGWRFSVDME